MCLIVLTQIYWSKRLIVIIDHWPVIKQRHDKTCFFCICENKDRDQLGGSPQLICAFVFARYIVQCLYLLNPKFQASINHILWLYGPVVLDLVGDLKTGFVLTRLN